MIEVIKQQEAREKKDKAERAKAAAAAEAVRGGKDDDDNRAKQEWAKALSSSNMDYTQVRVPLPGVAGQDVESRILLSGICRRPFAILRTLPTILPPPLRSFHQRPAAHAVCGHQPAGQQSVRRAGR